MSDLDSFALNILGATNLIASGDNKVGIGSSSEDGVDGEYEDSLELQMEDDELITLKSQWETKSSAYTQQIKIRQDKNKIYYSGRQYNQLGQSSQVIPTNLIFEAEETFIPASLAKNPEPVVWSDNTEEGKFASDDIKTLLQYHADVLCLRKKLGVMVRQWSIYFTGVVKHGWDSKINDITTDLRKPQNFILDPDGYIDEFGNYKGTFLGEKIDSSARELIKLFPKEKDYISLRVNEKLGTKIIRTEWWTDDYCFTTFEDKVLDKHKNEYFNYDTKETKESGEESATPGINHFAVPKMPYTFLSVFSLQEQPYDITNLIEQNIANQDRITSVDMQISKNLASMNNSVLLSGTAFNEENASEARDSFYEEGFLLVPNGDVNNAVKRIPADSIPAAVFTSQQNDKENLRSIFGTLGIAAQEQNSQATARGQILNQAHDSSRIGGGVGDALEQVADNIFNWWVQLYCVFYDEEHYASVMGNGQAVSYVKITNESLKRKFVVSVSPNSMKPKDEVSEMNVAIERWNNKAIDPIGFMKVMNDPDPMQSAERLVLWITNPQAYVQQYFPQQQPGQQNQTGQQLPPQQGEGESSLALPEASSSLSNVPLNS